MYDINVYQYESKPYNFSGKYGILPLNERGLKKYILGKNTHTWYYLSKFSPIVLSEAEEKEGGEEKEVKKKIILEPITKKKSPYALNVSKSTPSLLDKQKEGHMKGYSDIGNHNRVIRKNNIPLNLKHSIVKTEKSKSQKNIKFSSNLLNGPMTSKERNDFEKKLRTNFQSQMSDNP